MSGETHYLSQIDSAVYLQYGMLVQRPRASFVAYVLAGGPFTHFDRRVR